MKVNWFKRILDRPEGLIVSGFLGLIVAGSILLAIPYSHHGGVGPLEAVFTATSAVCVTGLTVVDTGTEFTLFGQVVILLLIQCGGLGIMSVAALAFQIIGRRLSFKAQAALQDTIFQRNAAAAFKKAFRNILFITFGAEFAGAAILYVSFAASGTENAAYSAIFHSISAFCNAGFSIYNDSLVAHRSNPGVMGAIMALVVFGGIGFPVILEIADRVRARYRKGGAPAGLRWSLHTRIVLWTTLILIVAGTVLCIVFGLTKSEGLGLSYVTNSLFSSVTARTAGFNTVDVGALPISTLFALVLLMFVGGSPGSCAGGVKTTALAVLYARLKASFFDRAVVTLGGRKIPGELMRKITLVFGLAVVWNLVGAMSLAGFESHSGMTFEALLFEQISAFGTVGLSTGITAELHYYSKIWIALTMFVGRVGPITVALAVAGGKGPDIGYPEERVMIG